MKQVQRDMDITKSIRPIAVLSIVAGWYCSAASGLIADEATATKSKPPELQRTAWTTSKIKGSPEIPLPYVTERAFPNLKFNQCLDITNAPGSDRLFIVEQTGKIFSFPNKPDVAAADLVIDLAKEVPGVRECYALTFHPDFAKNRYCYVCYIMAPDVEGGSHIARFKVSDTNPPTIDAKTETTIFTWRSGGHNGCCLKFGKDGCLYISTGDGSGPNPPDGLKAGQDVSNPLSSILRIDVDHADGGQNYRIPADNPFVDLKGARPEIWAYGFRNPWRMSFDRTTGDLWVGDVGWELWELLDRVERGGNYGWSVMEGRQATNPEWPRGPTPILPPTIDHPHSESSSITDGLTYYGSRLKELHGHHIYGDYDTGKIWGFRYAEGKVLDHRELADTTHRIVGFGEDATGEFYLLDHTAGTIHQLKPNPLKDTPSTFPRKLSDSGLFTSLERLTPAPGVMRYSINAEPWADGARAERLVAIPNAESILVQNEAWTFPKDSVLVKTLSFGPDPKRVETQILHFDGEEWQPYTYEWNPEETDAVLVEAAGLDRNLKIYNKQYPNQVGSKSWRFASRAECQRCHNKWAGSALAFNRPQLDLTLTAGEKQTSQLDEFVQLKLLDKPATDKKSPHLANPHDGFSEVNDRARSYLHVNCAHCHRMHAGSAVLSKMQYDLPLDKTDMIGVRPTQGTFGIPAAQVIAPGDPFRSVLYYRMSKLGGGRMPHIGSTEVDLLGVQLIGRWIREMSPSLAKDANVQATVSKQRVEETVTLQQLQGATSVSDQNGLVSKLLSSTTGALALLDSMEAGSFSNPKSGVSREVAAMVADKAAQHEDASIRDLFERFLPPEKRVKRLGSVVRPEQILALNGDTERGRKVFFETSGVSCKNCHRIQKDGKEVGPELTAIGKKLSRGQILESMLEPSKLIEPKYVTYLAETTEGQLLSGVLVSKDEQEVVLKDAEEKTHRIPAKQIEQLVPQRQSLMPDLLLRDMTAQQVADLLAYLASLR